MPLTITDFLLDRLEEDEQAAIATGILTTYAQPTARDRLRRVTVQTDNDSVVIDIVDPGPAQLAVVAHLWTWSPQRVLVECEAKRQVIEQASKNAAREPTWTPGSRYLGARPWHDLLGTFAAAYTDHPDYNYAWRP